MEKGRRLKGERVVFPGEGAFSLDGYCTTKGEGPGPLLPKEETPLGAGKRRRSANVETASAGIRKRKDPPPEATKMTLTVPNSPTKKEKGALFSSTVEEEEKTSFLAAVLVT